MPRGSNSRTSATASRSCRCITRRAGRRYTPPATARTATGCQQASSAHTLPGRVPCPDNKAVADVTKYNSDSAEEQFAVGSDCRVYHRWQKKAGGRFSRWSSMGGCASAHQGLAVGMNGDGELVAFVISPDHAVRYKSQSKPSLGPWTGWTSIGGDLSTGLHVVSAPSGSSPIRVFANDKSGNPGRTTRPKGRETAVGAGGAKYNC